MVQSAKKQYNASEKTKIALEALKGELTIAQISSKYGVHATQINRWRQQAVAAIAEGFNKTHAKAATEQTDLINKLYQQIGQLSTECDWLKKKAELFKL